MGRQHKHERPRYFLVGGGTQDDAEHRLHELLHLAKPTGGAPVRIDRLREAMTIADIYPPTGRDQWRRHRSKVNRGITPRREERAATMLMEIFASRGDPLTRQNATRIIEQARAVNDRARGITRQARQNIEAARDMMDALRRLEGQPTQPFDRERKIIAEALDTLRTAHSLCQWDRALRDAAATLIGRAVVH